VFAGSWGLPGAEPTKLVIEKSYEIAFGEKLDLESTFRQFANEISGQEWMGQALNRGLVGTLVGSDVSRRVGLGQSPLTDVLGAAVGTDSGSVFGAAGSYLVEGKRFMEKLQATGDWQKALLTTNPFLPTAAKNIAAALYINSQGLKDNKENLTFVQPEDTGIGDAVRKGIGFTPMEHTEIRALDWAQRKADTAVQIRTSNYHSRLAQLRVKYKRALVAGDIEKSDDLRGQIKKLRTALKKYNRHQKDAGRRHLIIQTNWNRIYEIQRQIIRGQRGGFSNKSRKKRQELEQAYGMGR